MTEIISERMKIVRIVEKICAVFLLLFVFCTAAVFLASVFEINIEIPNSILFVLKWGLIISLILLIITAAIEFVTALKQKQ
ncbi:hypothetical protein MmiHf6_08190 [Methanimicrococcus hongohii]|uniref:Uncharacterized protein n=1 Tax=Methanimicrococcus hongohii TaxID=3028295 RepID=A0AA96ZTR2_9EURY|nr:hypothetical protein [Methanimicrococcus sp. Hf6]WNY23511.1 hypothetical protein MmiHf6_08190 [Methanimicrococcus sp. Hf6]